jgi:ABC-type multidrug transport system fused ATPase/permease subunit
MSDWRNNIGYVSQDIFLIDDTVANNIRFYDSTISDEAIINAARLAYIDEFVQGLPDKYETIVGERGVRLSGGQKQRVVLARILAREPELLILDEATSALDNESELAIQNSIQNLRGKITVFAIAHRLSTLENSDRLLVIEDGKISEQGVPQELLKNPDSYFSKVFNLRDGIK